MSNGIYIPRPMVDEIIRNSQLPATWQRHNLQLCVKIPYRGLEISLALDSNHGQGDLHRGDIRVYDPAHGGDITSLFLRGDANMLYVTSEELYEVFKLIDTYTPNKVAC